MNTYLFHVVFLIIIPKYMEKTNRFLYSFFKIRFGCNTAVCSLLKMTFLCSALFVCLCLSAYSREFSSDPASHDFTVTDSLGERPNCPGDSTCRCTPKCRMPVFKGEGIDAASKYVERKVVYPYVALINEIEGDVRCSFVVGKDGKVRDVKILRGLEKNIDSQVYWIIRRMPKWEPAFHNGKPVSFLVGMTVRFVFSDE